MASLFEALKQYLRDAAPGGVLNPEGQPVANYGKMVRGNLASLLDDPAAFTQSALLDVLPSGAELDSVRARAEGRDYDKFAYQKAMDKAIDLGSLVGSIRVYHGSPHKFDKFDMSKMGTGEGAQAYGHGAYFADNPAVAQAYQPRDPKFEDNVMRLYKNAERAGDYDSMAVYERYLLHDTPDSVAQYVKEAAEEGGDARKLQQAHEAAKRAWERQASGALYEADLRWPDAAREAADPMGPQHFLDYDAPFAKQPAHIKKLIQERLKELGYSGDANGLRAYHIEHGGFADSTGETLARMFGGDPAASSKWLMDRGVPGIRYLDQGSRAAGKGTNNYVVFDDALIEILKRNGVPVKGK